MPQFQCDLCGCVENTALSFCSISPPFASDEEELNRYRELVGLKPGEKFGRYCSECCPSGDRKWHGLFDRVYLPKGKFETDPKGGLWHKVTHEDYKAFIKRTE